MNVSDCKCHGRQGSKAKSKDRKTKTVPKLRAKSLENIVNRCWCKGTLGKTQTSKKENTHKYSRKAQCKRTEGGRKSKTQGVKSTRETTTVPTKTETQELNP